MIPSKDQTTSRRPSTAIARTLMLAAIALALGGVVATSSAPAAVTGSYAGDALDTIRSESSRMALQGTPLAVATPSAAATPVAGCGNEASSPTEIAEVLLATATAGDLERAALCFAPESQPASWAEVFLGGSEEGWDDVTGCRGLPYVVTESQIRTGVAAIIFNFDDACAVARLDSWQRDLYDAETLNVTTVVVQTYRADERLYVWDASALVPD